MYETCFVDYDYPRGCATWTIPTTNFRCVSIAESTTAACDVVYGLETRAIPWFVNATGRPYVTGATYAVSFGLSVLKTTGIETAKRGGGWAFLLPFSWQVWTVLLGCVVSAFAAQMFVRGLDAYRKKTTSPDLDVPETEMTETAQDVFTSAFTAVLGSTRLFAFYEGPYVRHAASMAVAIFSVFVMAMYTSNLVAFSFPDSMSASSSSWTAERDATYAVHWAFVDALENDVAVKLGRMGASVVPWYGTIDTALTMGYVPVAPTKWLLPYCSVGVLQTMYAYKIMYDVAYVNASNVSKKIVDGPVSCAERPAGVASLDLGDVWGVFVIAGAGVAISMACRVVSARRAREPLFGGEFRWFSLGTPSIGRPTTIENEAAVVEAAVVEAAVVDAAVVDADRTDDPEVDAVFMNKKCIEML